MNLKEAVVKYGYSVLVTMLLAGTVFIEIDHPLYRCDSNDPPLKECDRLSGSGRTCYNAGSGDLCPDGTWDLIEQKPVTDVTGMVYVSANGKEWGCDTDNGKVWSYSKCSSEGHSSYLGELI